MLVVGFLEGSVAIHSAADPFSMAKKVEGPKNTTDSKPTRKVGRPRAYTPEALEATFEEYVEWAKKHPLSINKVSAGEIIAIPTERPLTLVGFCVFADIVENTFREYERQEEFLSVTTRARTAFANSQIEGALIGAYNPNIVARLQGLADRQDVTTNGKDIQQVPAISFTVDEAAASIIQSIGKQTINSIHKDGN